MLSRVDMILGQRKGWFDLRMRLVVDEGGGFETAFWLIEEDTRVFLESL